MHCQKANHFLFECQLLCTDVPSGLFFDSVCNPQTENESFNFFYTYLSGSILKRKQLSSNNLFFFLFTLENKPKKKHHYLSYIQKRDKVIFYFCWDDKAEKKKKYVMRHYRSSVRDQDIRLHLVKNKPSRSYKVCSK